MAQQTLINGETYGSHREKLNTMLAELYGTTGNVRRVELTGNSTTDTALLIDAIGTAGRSVEILTPGTFSVDDTLLLDSGVTFYSNVDVTLKSSAGINRPVLKNKDRVSGNSKFKIAGIVFDGNKAQQTTAFSTVDLLLCSEFLIDDIDVRNALRTGTFPTVSSDGEGLILRQCTHGNVTNSRSRSNTYDGFGTRQCQHITFTNIHSVDDGRSGIQIKATNNDFAFRSSYITVNGLLVEHSTGTPDAPCPTTAGIYLHAATFCTVSNVIAVGTRQGMGGYDGCQDNMFSNMVLRTRAFAGDSALFLQTGGANLNSRNFFNNIKIRGLSGAAGSLLLLDASAFTNEFTNISAAAGDGTGTWTMTLGTGSTSNIVQGTRASANTSFADTGSTNTSTGLRAV